MSTFFNDVCQSSFKTKTMILAQPAPIISDKYLIGIDVGYSGCKVYAQNKVVCFPCYARQIQGEIMSTNFDATDIWYRDDETNELWAVGESAVSMMSSRDTNDNALSICTRNRYFDPMFKVVLRTGLGLGLMSNYLCKSEGKEIFVESGLPAAYMTDEDIIRDAICGTHNFSIKFGNEAWKKFSISLDNEHVEITSQPKGTLFSSIVDSSGNFVSNSSKILKSRSIIFDAGFNTLDLVRNINGVIDSNFVTFDDLGMKQVFTELANEIEQKYHQHIEIPYIQFVLKTGNLTVYDRKNKKTIKVPITDMLEEKSKDVCEKAIGKIRTMYNDLLDMDYLIVTGGTGEAWWDIIKNDFSGIETLEVIPGNNNSNLPFTFSNVRGYFFHLYRNVKRKVGTI